jgi:hypothetical protein
MQRTTATLALALGALATSPVAVAGDDEHDTRKDGTETFEGTCEFAGRLHQRPPLTNVPQAGRGFAVARGTCTGTFTDEDGRVRRLNAERVGYFASAEGTLTCGGGEAAGNGFLLIRGERLDFRFTELRGPGAGAIRLDGAGGGSAAGVARVSAEEDPMEIAERCSGRGLREVDIEIDIATTPAISG